MDTSPAGAHRAETAEWEPPLPAAPGFAHRMVRTPGLRSHVATVGAGAPVLLLHGFPQHWWQWRVVAPAIAEHGYHVVCPDLRGAGWTAAEDRTLKHETRLRDVLALLDALEIERAHVMAHDLGAITGMQLAYEHPERVRSLVQLSVPPGFMRFSPRIIPAFRHYPPLLLSSPDRSLRWLLEPPYTVRPMTGATVDGYLRVEKRSEVAAATRAVLLGMIMPEIPRLLGGHYRRRQLQPPTLVAFGRRDWPFTEPVVRRISRDTRHARRFELAFIDDAAHFVTDDAPEAVAALASEWFEREGGDG